MQEIVRSPEYKVIPHLKSFEELSSRIHRREGERRAIQHLMPQRIYAKKNLSLYENVHLRFKNNN